MSENPRSPNSPDSACNGGDEPPSQNRRRSVAPRFVRDPRHPRPQAPRPPLSPRPQVPRPPRSPPNRVPRPHASRSPQASRSPRASRSPQASRSSHAPRQPRPQQPRSLQRPQELPPLYWLQSRSRHPPPVQRPDEARLPSRLVQPLQDLLERHIPQPEQQPHSTPHQEPVEIIPVAQASQFPRQSDATRQALEIIPLILPRVPVQQEPDSSQESQLRPHRRSESPRRPQTSRQPITYIDLPHSSQQQQPELLRPPQQPQSTTRQPAILILASPPQQRPQHSQREDRPELSQISQAVDVSLQQPSTSRRSKLSQRNGGTDRTPQQPPQQQQSLQTAQQPQTSRRSVSVLEMAPPTPQQSQMIPLQIAQQSTQQTDQSIQESQEQQPLQQQPDLLEVDVVLELMPLQSSRQSSPLISPQRSQHSQFRQSSPLTSPQQSQPRQSSPLISPQQSQSRQSSPLTSPQQSQSRQSSPLISPQQSQSRQSSSLTSPQQSQALQTSRQSSPLNSPQPSQDAQTSRQSSPFAKFSQILQLQLSPQSQRNGRSNFEQPREEQHLPPSQQQQATETGRQSESLNVNDVVLDLAPLQSSSLKSPKLQLSPQHNGSSKKSPQHQQIQREPHSESMDIYEILERSSPLKSPQHSQDLHQQLSPQSQNLPSSISPQSQTNGRCKKTSQQQPADRQPSQQTLKSPKKSHSSRRKQQKNRRRARQKQQQQQSQTTQELQPSQSPQRQQTAQTSSLLQILQQPGPLHPPQNQQTLRSPHSNGDGQPSREPSPQRSQTLQSSSMRSLQQQQQQEQSIQPHDSHPSLLQLLQATSQPFSSNSFRQAQPSQSLQQSQCMRPPPLIQRPPILQPPVRARSSDGPRPLQISQLPQSTQSSRPRSPQSPQSPHSTQQSPQPYQCIQMPYSLRYAQPMRFLQEAPSSNQPSIIQPVPARRSSDQPQHFEPVAHSSHQSPIFRLVPGQSSSQLPLIEPLAHSSHQPQRFRHILQGHSSPQNMQVESSTSAYQLSHPHLLRQIQQPLLSQPMQLEPLPHSSHQPQLFRRRRRSSPRSQPIQVEPLPHSSHQPQLFRNVQQQQPMEHEPQPNSPNQPQPMQCTSVPHSQLHPQRQQHPLEVLQRLLHLGTSRSDSGSSSTSPVPPSRPVHDNVEAAILKYPWLMYDNFFGFYYCSICIRSLERGGSLNDVRFLQPFYDANFETHENCTNHINNCADVQSHYENDPQERVEIDERRYINLMMAVKAVFIIVDVNHALSFNPRCLWYLKQGEPNLYDERFNYDVSSLLKCVYNLVMRIVKRKVKKSKYISFIIDNEFKTRCPYDSYFLYIRYITEGKLRHSLLAHVEDLQDFNVMHDFLDRLGLDIYKLVSVGISGYENPLVDLLEAIERDSFAHIYRCTRKLHKHIVQHLLIIDGIFNTMAGRIKLIGTLMSPYIFAEDIERCEGKFLRTLTKCKLLGVEDNMLFKIDSMRSVLRKRDHVMEKTKEIVFNKLYQSTILMSLKDNELMFFMKFLMDLIAVLKQMGIILKKKNNLLWNVKEEILNLIKNVERVRINNITTRRDSEDNDMRHVNSLINETCKNVVNYLRCMIRTTIYEVADATRIFDTSNWPEEYDSSYGIREIKILYDYCKNHNDFELEDEVAIANALVEWKSYLYVHKGMSLEQLLWNTYKKSDTYPILYELLQVVVLQAASYHNKDHHEQLRRIDLNLGENKNERYATERLVICDNIKKYSEIDIKTIAKLYARLRDPRNQ